MCRAHTSRLISSNINSLYPVFLFNTDWKFVICGCTSRSSEKNNNLLKFKWKKKTSTFFTSLFWWSLFTHDSRRKEKKNKNWIIFRYLNARRAFDLLSRKAWIRFTLVDVQTKTDENVFCFVLCARASLNRRICVRVIFGSNCSSSDSSPNQTTEAVGNRNQCVRCALRQCACECFLLSCQFFFFVHLFVFDAFVFGVLFYFIFLLRSHTKWESDFQLDARNRWMLVLSMTENNKIDGCALLFRFIFAYFGSSAEKIEWIRSCRFHCVQTMCSAQIQWWKSVDLKHNCRFITFFSFSFIFNQIAIKMKSKIKFHCSKSVRLDLTAGHSAAVQFEV